MPKTTLSRSSSPLSETSCPPRFHIASPGTDNLADETIALSEYAGVHIGDAPWKRAVLSDFTSIRSDGKFVHHRCGLAGPRQMGKSWLLIGFALMLALVGYKVLWTEHSYTTVLEMFRRFKAIFGTKTSDPSAMHPRLNSEVSEVSSSTANEHIMLRSGGGIWFATRTKTTSLGFEFDIIIIDEAQECSGDEFQAITPTTSGGSKHNSMLVYSGTPERPESNGEEFGKFRDDVLGTLPDPEDCWFEWSVPDVGNVLDVERLRRVNPSIGYTADIDAIMTGIRSMLPLKAAQEYFGYWLPGAADAAIDRELWDACMVKPADAAQHGRIAWAVKFSPDGHSVALSACVTPDTGIPHVELVEYRGLEDGSRWLVDFLIARWEQACVIVIDGKSGRKELYERLRAAGVPDRVIVLPGVADVTTAASMLVTAIREHAITHIRQGYLDDSVSSSVRRRIGREGGWGFGGDMSGPIESCSFAFWGAATSHIDPSREQEVNF